MATLLVASPDTWAGVSDTGFAMQYIQSSLLSSDVRATSAGKPAHTLLSY